MDNQHLWYDEYSHHSLQATERMDYEPSAAGTEYTHTDPIPNVPHGYCAGCHQFIRDRHYLSAVGRDWHITCLVCSVCHIPLDSHGTCYTKDGLIYCRQDYYSRYGWKQCARCLTSIAATELVMRVKQLVYHINCFACVECNERFSAGQQYALVGASVYCRAHYQQLLSATAGGPSARSQGGPVPVLSPDEYPSSSSLQPSLQLDATTRNYNSTSPTEDHRVSVTSSTYYNAVSMVTTMGSGGGNKGGRSSRKRKSPPLEGGTSSDTVNGYCGQTSSLGDAMCIGEGGVDMILRRPTRQKRLRTSFKHHELRVMKSYFSLNHNPDAKDLKQLSIKTGLSKRVLQVWFQNARAKFRRNSQKESKDYHIRQQQPQPSSGDGRSTDSRPGTCRPITTDLMALTSSSSFVTTSSKDIIMTTTDDITRLSPSLLDLNSQSVFNCQVAQSPRNVGGATEMMPSMSYIRGTFNSVT